MQLFSVSNGVSTTTSKHVNKASVCISIIIKGAMGIDCYMRNQITSDNIFVKTNVYAFSKAVGWFTEYLYPFPERKQDDNAMH